MKKILARVEIPSDHILRRAHWLATHKFDPITVVSYRQAELDAEELSSKLLAEFGPSHIRSLSFRAIPRGGYIVLGMVAYCLDLPASCFDPSHGSSPHVVIDDCARTGMRFRDFLQQLPNNRVFFAPLYSSSQLFSAIQETEPRVIGCALAHELRDLSDKHFPDPESRAEWNQFWLDRAGTRSYWLGDLEHVIFPWNEPDRVFWNADANSTEDGWRFASPELCLRNRNLFGISSVKREKAELRLASGIAYNLRPDEILLCRMETQEVISLTDSSAEMWRALVFFGNYSQALSHLMSIFDVETKVVESDLAAFAEELISRGFMEPIRE